jgi:glycosyltransferase involved in cell wall biosynthesis
MRVLLVNKFNFLKGGADKYFLDLAELLLSKKVKVAKFAMRHPSNLPDKYSRYWPTGVNFDRFSHRHVFKYFSHIFWNFEAARQFGKVIKEFKPDIIHINNIYHHLSPSILPVAKRYHLPVVMHLHDYKLISPNYKLFSRGEIDESAKGGHWWRSVAKRGIKDSYFKSFIAATEMWWHHNVLKVYEKNVDLFIAPSQFMKNKMVEWGVDEAKIVVLYHFIDTKKFKPEFALGDYLLYFGRLDQGKGVDNLLKAMVKVKGNMKLKIVGSGSEYKVLKEMTKKLGLEKRVEFLGPKYDQELKEVIRQAYLVIIPSRLYEVFGLVNLEAGALGKFVIASNIGGIPEAVQSRHSALLFNYDSSDDLATKINWSLDNPRAVSDGAKEAREFVEKNFSPDQHFAGLMKIYEKLLASTKN